VPAHSASGGQLEKPQLYHAADLITGATWWQTLTCLQRIRRDVRRRTSGPLAITKRLSEKNSEQGMSHSD